MMRRFSHILLGILLGVLSSGWMIAQTQTNPRISKKELNAIAGCLSRSGNEYHLLGSNGSLWEIQVEKPIDLSSLIGKRVEAKGSVSSENTGKNTASKQTQNEKKNQVRGHMKANSVRQIEGACP